MLLTIWFEAGVAGEPLDTRRRMCFGCAVELAEEGTEMLAVIGIVQRGEHVPTCHQCGEPVNRKGVRVSALAGVRPAP